MKHIYDFIIIGCGITGVSFARLLQQRNISNFLILEKEGEPGGLCRTKNINGTELDISGGRFFNTKYTDVQEWIFNHIPERNFNKYDRISKISIGSDFIDYPVEYNLWQLPWKTYLKYLLSVILKNPNIKTQNYSDWIYSKLGKKIADNYLIPYNEKLWGLPIQELAIDWLHKIPSVKLKHILKSCINRTHGYEYIPSHATFFYPRQGGFQSVFNSIYRYIRRHVKLNYHIKTLRYLKGLWVINNIYRCRNLINTAPWTEIFSALDKPSMLYKDFSNLKYTSLEINLYNKTYSHNWHWIYVPDKTKYQHREFFIYNFNPNITNKNMFFTESNILSKGEKRDNAIFRFVNKYAYPIPIINHSNYINNILEYYKDKKLFGLGRWGQWEYMNSDVCIKKCFDLIEILT